MAETMGIVSLLAELEKISVGLSHSFADSAMGYCRALLRSFGIHLRQGDCVKTFTFPEVTAGTLRTDD